MILIFGGVYQGKLDYALSRFELTEDDVAFCIESCAISPERKKIVYNVDKWILALLRAEENIAKHAQKFIENNHDSIVICNDISCGIVPQDPILRRWREEVGRFMGMLAQHSDEVIRLYCGIPTILKGENQHV